MTEVMHLMYLLDTHACAYMFMYDIVFFFCDGIYMWIVILSTTLVYKIGVVQIGVGHFGSG